MTDIRVIAEQDWAWRLYAGDDRLFLSVLCGTIGLYERVIELQPKEVADWSLQGEVAIGRLARWIMRHPGDFAMRHIDGFQQWPQVIHADAEWRLQGQGVTP